MSPAEQLVLRNISDVRYEMLITQSAHRHDSSYDNSTLTLADSPIFYIVLLLARLEHKQRKTDQ